MTPNQHPNWPEGYNCVVLDQVDSTMAEASRRASELSYPTWIMAHEQLDARGRRGRAWSNPKGNLSATLLMKPLCTAQAAAQRSFVAANALLEALSIYIDRRKISLKWPNDVLINGGKVAGILLESSGRGPFVDWLSVGIGVNLSYAPDIDGAAFSPVSVAGEGGEPVRPEDFLVTLATAFATQEKKLDAMGFARIREDWLKHAARLGETISARTSTETIEGLFDTIDKDGNLVLITAKGPKAIPAADVYF